MFEIIESGKLERKLSGRLAEMQFEYEAAKRGITVSEPIVSFCPYDCIADIKGHLYKCQIKRAWQRRDCLSVICDIRRQSVNGFGKPLYENGDFDFLCVIYEDTIYIIPWAKISEVKQTITLSKFQNYINNWDFLL